MTHTDASEAANAFFIIMKYSVTQKRLFRVDSRISKPINIDSTRSIFSLVLQSNNIQLPDLLRKQSQPHYSSNLYHRSAVGDLQPVHSSSHTLRNFYRSPNLNYASTKSSPLTPRQDRLSYRGRPHLQGQSPTYLSMR